MLNVSRCCVTLHDSISARMENLAMDMQARLGRDHLWKTFLRRGSTVSMEKSLVFLEFLMVFSLSFLHLFPSRKPSVLSVIASFWYQGTKGLKSGILALFFQAMVEQEQLSM